jgi:hypothetical protein
VRVTKPGGYVGLNEGCWTGEPSPELVALVKDAIGPAVSTLETWQALWEASGLKERVVKIHRIDARKELRGRMQLLGARWVLGGFGRLLRLYFKEPASRPFLKDMFNAPLETLEYMGYGLFVGQKPGG